MCSHQNRLVKAILMSAHNIPFTNIDKKITLNYPESAAMGFFSNGLKNEFEATVVNEPSAFEPQKFYYRTEGSPDGDAEVNSAYTEND